MIRIRSSLYCEAEIHTACIGGNFKFYFKRYFLCLVCEDSSMMQPLATIATASSTFVGQNWGAGKPERIHTALRRVTAMEIGWSLFGCGLVFAFGGALVRLTTGTSDTEVVRNAVMSLRWHLSFFPALGCLLALRTAMQAMGQKTAPILSSCIELGMKLLSAALLIPRLGFFGTSITEPITWSLMLLFLAAAYFGSQTRMFSTMATEKGAME